MVWPDGLSEVDSRYALAGHRPGFVLPDASLFRGQRCLCETAAIGCARSIAVLKSSRCV